MKTIDPSTPPTARRRAALVGPAAALTLATLTLLTPDSADAAWLPGWGIDSSEGITQSWCSAASESLYLGDFDGDGQIDLVCHNVSTGRRKIDFSSPTNRGFWGSNWDSENDPYADKAWCQEAGALVLVGDFNGDGRDDLLCEKPRNTTDAGRKRIDFAEPGGWLRGTDWDSKDKDGVAQTWCTNAGESILVGDFNGDGKDDLLCRVPYGYTNAGRKRIDYANSAGTFWGTNFDSLGYPSTDQTWCVSAGASVHVGDFNGDGKDDLLCHTPYSYANAGRRRIDFAGAPELPFEGDDFDSSIADGAVPSWCATNGDNLRIGDVNGDGKDDLVCANGVANGAYRGIRVDHANSAGSFYGTNGQAHHENWCTSVATSSFYTGDFDGDGGADVLCHDRSSGYRGVRYVNAAGDFHSLCSDDSTLGDGELPSLPVHFAVAADPSLPFRTALPTDQSNHVHPFTGAAIDQSVDDSLYFKAEVEVMNYYARSYDPDPNNGGIFADTCVDQDCIRYEYESHALYSEIANTWCQEVLAWTNYPGPEYTPNCESVPGFTGECFPTECNDNPQSDDDAYNFGFGCAIRHCSDPRVYKPQALNVVVMDRCAWEGDAVSGGITYESCKRSKKSQSFGLGESHGFLTGWDYERMLRGTAGPLSRDNASGLEQHELGHVLGLGHIYDCSQNRNAMDKYPGEPAAVCRDIDGEIWREAGYSADIGVNHKDQIESVVTAARDWVDHYACV